MVEYKQGKDNKVVDALSRNMESIDLNKANVMELNDKHKATVTDASLTAITEPSSDWLEQLKTSHVTDANVQKLIQELQQGKSVAKHYQDKNGLLFYKGRLVIPTSEVVREQILYLLHSSPQGGHSGFHKTLHRARAEFYWAAMKGDIKKFIRECDTCQQNKYENIHPPWFITATTSSSKGLD